MTPRFTKVILITLLAGFALLSMAQADLRWKPMMFDNPGTKRALKTENRVTFYYRSLPEKTMLLNVKDISAIEIRAFSKVRQTNPQFFIISGGKKQAFTLKSTAISEQYEMFEPVRINLMPNTTKIELLAYDRNTYFRAYYPVQIQKKKTHIPPLKITGFVSAVIIKAQKSSSKYYSGNSTTPVSFTVNKGYAAQVYLRAQLTDKTKPVIGIYRDGTLINKVNLDTKRTNTYTIEGIQHLTTGKKTDLPMQDKLSKYELRSLSGHLFFAKPVILKKK